MPPVVPRRLAVVLAVLAGCASPDFAVAPRYATSVEGTPADAPPASVRLEVRDGRGTRGAAKGEGGEVLAAGSKGSVFVEEPYEAIVRRGVEEALRARGQRVEPDGDVVVEVELTRLALEANEFVDWPMDSETGSTLDALRVFIPRKTRETKAETDLRVTVRRRGVDYGYSELAQRVVAEASRDREVVEKSLSRALSEAADEVSDFAVRSLAKAAALPVTARELDERDRTISGQTDVLEGERSTLAARERALAEERREVEALRQKAAADRELAARLQEELARLDAREEDVDRLQRALADERREFDAERTAMSKWRRELASAPAPEPPAEVSGRAPSVVITSPELTGQTNTRGDLTVEGVAFSSRGVEGVELVLNGVRLGEQRGGRFKRRQVAGEDYKKFSFRFSLREGVNTVEIIARDRFGETAKRQLEVRHEKPRGDVFVVAIGIDRYENEEIEPLRFAARDAQAVAGALRDCLQPASVRVLLDEEATASAVKSALSQGTGLAEAGAEDLVVVYYAGHGAVAPNPTFDDGFEKFLLPVDAGKDLAVSAISMFELQSMLLRLKSERVVFIADTCYSGAAGGRGVSLVGLAAEDGPSEGPETRPWGTGRAILTASRASEPARENTDLNHGVFTHYLLEALRDPASDRVRDGQLEIQELYEYVRERVSRATGGAQNPQISRHGGEIVLASIE